MILFSRILVALLLVILGIVCFYYDAVFYIVYFMFSMGIYTELDINNVNVLFTSVLMFYTFIMPLILTKNKLLEAVAFSQTSDICQYIWGKVYVFIANKLYKSKWECICGNHNMSTCDCTKYITLRACRRGHRLRKRCKSKDYFISISPNKTFIGYIFGYLSVLIIFYKYYPVLLITIYYIAGCVGDLIFSYIKRGYDIKDFSSLLRSHGGLLDRFDSTIGLLMFSLLYDQFF